MNSNVVVVGGEDDDRNDRVLAERMSASFKDINQRKKTFVDALRKKLMTEDESGMVNQDPNVATAVAGTSDQKEDCDFNPVNLQNIAVYTHQILFLSYVFFSILRYELASTIILVIGVTIFGLIFVLVKRNQITGFDEISKTVCSILNKYPSLKNMLENA